MYTRKVLTTALLFTMFLSLFAAFVGENFQEDYESIEITPIEDMGTLLKDLRGTRAESFNVDLMGRVPFGYVWDVWVEGNYAYVGVSNCLLILDITDKTSPSIIGCYDTEDWVVAVQVSGSYAYLANFGQGLTIIDVSIPSNPTLAASLGTTLQAIDIYVSGSYVYLVDGLELILIYVNEPTNPVRNGSYSIWAAVGVYASYPYAYVASLEQGVPQDDPGLWIIDVSDPDNLEFEGHNDTARYAYDVFVSGQYAYVANGSGGLRIFDVSNPSDPIEIGYNDTFGSDMGVDVIGSYAFVAAGQEGFRIVDVSDPYSPFEIGAYTDNAARKIHVLGSYAYIAGVDDSFHIVDISDLGNPVESGGYETQGIPMDVFATDSKAYIAAWGDIFTESTGLWIVDITSPSDPEILGNYDTPGDSRAVFVDGNYAYVADGDYGLRVISVADPNDPSEEGEFITPNAADVYIVDSNAYLADWDEGLKVIDISTPSSPEEIGSYPDYGGAALYVSGSFAYMAAGPNGLRIINISDPSSPTEIGFYDSIEVWDVQVHGRYAYVLGEDSGLTILDIDSPSNPTYLGNLNTFTDPRGIYVSWRYVYVADDEDGFRVVDVDDPSNPIEIGYYVNPGGAIGVFTIDRYAYVCGDYGLFIFDVIDTLDTSPPNINLVSPSEDSTDIPLNTNIQATFSENMEHSYTENAFSITPHVSGDFTWSGNSMIFDPDVNLTSFTTYQVVISASAKDTAGNSLDGNENGVAQGSPTDDFSWEFTTAVPPEIESTLPESGSINIPLDSSIMINFTKSMDISSVESAFNYSNGLETWDVQNGVVLWANEFKTFIFTPDSDFDFGAEYQVTVAHTAMDQDSVLLDVDGDFIPGEIGEDDYTWSFTTIPLPPQIITTSPLPGSTFVPINSSVTIEFSKSMHTSSTQEALTYTYEGITFDSTNGFVTWSNDDRIMTFTPQVLFQNEKVYIIKIDSTATDIDGIYFDGDEDGNGGEEIEDDYIWSFTTMPVPPKVLSTTPKKNAIEVPVDTVIEVMFSNPMDESSVEEAFTFTHEDTNVTWDAFDGNVSWKDESKIMTFKPSFVLEYNMIYTLKIEATAKDKKGITLDGNKNNLPEGVDTDDYQSYFTTVPEPPRVESVEPSDGLTDVAIDADIVITFDKSMNKGSVEKAFSYTYKGSDESYDKSDGSIEWTNYDKVLTFNPDLDFEEGERYTVTIDDSAKDEDGIAFEGYEWSFTIKVNSAPVLAGGGVNPEKGDTSKMFKFSIVYTDEDDDRPESIEVVIGDISWRMLESDPQDEDYTDGKNYEFEISLDEGDHKYYFEASDEKHDVRFPAGQGTDTVKVSAVEEELLFGFLEEEYAGMPTLICGPIGIIFIIGIIISLILIMRGGRPREEPMTFEPFEEAAPPMAFIPSGEEDIMSFTAFEEAPSLEEARPVLIQCPECDRHLRVRAVTRPFMFPCSCGAKLILK